MVPVTTVEVDPELSFVLTETTLAYASVPETDSPTVTMTDPDAATTTAEALPASETTALAVAPLPVGIPNKILPNPQLDLSTVQDGFSLVSILFKSTLNWPFVVANEISSSQIFAYSKVLIATALQIPGDEVKTYALQVFIPSTYKSPSDAAQLGTIYLAYIPSELVEDLASQLKAKNSRFYTAVNDNVALALAQNVNSAFSVTSVVDPNGPGSEVPEGVMELARMPEDRARKQREEQGGEEGEQGRGGSKGGKRRDLKEDIERFKRAMKAKRGKGRGSEKVKRKVAAAAA
ncbi:hypothetical protein NMY22_g13303 [Coprinellus aureogranulatus]|nr:hypothetical protein NMY22_g13303 [Coprinellus aureogranulatus]